MAVEGNGDELILGLEVRTDPGAGLVRARMRVGGRGVEVSTLSLGVADNVPGAFRAWLDGLKQIGRLWAEAAGGRVSRVEEIDPAELN